jgi:phospholipid transport system substrate-binding protein
MLVPGISAWIILLLLVGSGPVLAMQSPQALVQETTDKIKSALKADQEKIKSDPGYLRAVVDTIVAPHFDFDRMSSWALGKYWRKAKPDEKTRFSHEFRALLVRTYAKALNDNYDKAIDMLPMRKKKGGKEVIVRTEVQQSAGFPIPISYKMHIKNDAWMIYDVSVDGISLVANYRSSFAKEIRKDGLPKFIDRLARRNNASGAKKP